jgi:hypothetical protein
MQILLIAGMSFSNFCFWFLGSSYDTRRKRMNHWLWWYYYCEDRHLTVKRMIEKDHPNFLITDFIV